MTSGALSLNSLLLLYCHSPPSLTSFHHHHRHLHWNIHHHHLHCHRYHHWNIHHHHIINSKHLYAVCGEASLHFIIIVIIVNRYHHNCHHRHHHWSWGLISHLWWPAVWIWECTSLLPVANHSHILTSITDSYLFAIHLNIQVVFFTCPPLKS